LLALVSAAIAAGALAVTDHTSYNAGSEVRVQLQSIAGGRAAIRYARERQPMQKDIAVSGSGYVHLWNIPSDARTGRYEVDLTLDAGKPVQNAASFAVYRQLAKVVSVDLDKTFYTLLGKHNLKFEPPPAWALYRSCIDGDICRSGGGTQSNRIRSESAAKIDSGILRPPGR
jgi:hypothetical protein